jgi:hypothetical protein
VASHLPCQLLKLTSTVQTLLQNKTRVSRTIKIKKGLPNSVKVEIKTKKKGDTTFWWKGIFFSSTERWVK